MINSLVFKKLNYIEFSELTLNNIFIFDTIRHLRSFYKEFEKLIKDVKYKNILYSTNNHIKEIKIYECNKCRGFTVVYRVDDTQRFIFTLEPMSILSMTSYNDLWFVSKENNKWDIFNFTDYENYESYKTNEDIYKFVCASRYGMK